MDIEDFLSQHGIKLFHRQHEAIEYQEKEPDARLFSFESLHLDKGGRRYICVPISKFFDFYSQQIGNLHFYEIIQEGRPCRAYFDLEFQREFNKLLDPLTCFKDFIQLCRETFSTVLKLNVPENKFMVLDSSTESKYSAHVIVHLPGNRLFANHLVLKHFVDQLTTEMIKQCRCLVVADEEKPAFLCDTNVYTKNRNFRLYYSSKKEKTARLEYADYCKFYERKPFDRKIFLDSLVVPENYKDCQLIELHEMAVSSLFNAGNSPPQKRIVIDESQPLSCLNNQVCDSQSSQISNTSNKSGRVRDLRKGSGPSPFPALDDWFIKMIRQRFPETTIRLWTLSYVDAYSRRQIQYALNNCRFCHNIQRQHKRQNVYWIVNLEEFYAYQRCFDIDCRAFTSTNYPVPEMVSQKCIQLLDKVFGSFGISPSEATNDENDSHSNTDFQGDTIEVVYEAPKKMPKIEK